MAGHYGAKRYHGRAMDGIAAQSLLDVRSRGPAGDADGPKRDPQTPILEVPSERY
jgi:hypothetical protein